MEENLRRAERMDSVTLLFQIFVELLQLSTDEATLQPNSRPISPTMRAEVRKLDRYLEEYHLLCDNGIHSPQDFTAWRERLDSRIASLEQQRYAAQAAPREITRRSCQLERASQSDHEETRSAAQAEAGCPAD